MKHGLFVVLVTVLELRDSPVEVRAWRAAYDRFQKVCPTLIEIQYSRSADICPKRVSIFVPVNIIRDVAVAITVYEPGRCGGTNFESLRVSKNECNSATHHHSFW